MHERVVAVIVTYNGSDWIDRCLDSVRDEGGVAEVIIVDNASTDDTVQRANQYGSFVRVVQLQRNMGFGRANNVGMQLALDDGAEYVCLLNQDIIVYPGVVALLVESLKKNLEFAMVGTLQIMFADDRIDPPFREGCIPAEFWDDLVLRTPKELYDVKFMPAAAVVVRRADLFLIGGFDPLFFMYAEDADFCDRLRRAGRKVGLVPQARVRHWHGLINSPRTLNYVVNREFSRFALAIKRSKSRLLVAYSRLFGIPPGAFPFRVRLRS